MSGHLIFDLDGTLVDTYPGIRYSILQALGEVFPGCKFDHLDLALGPPVREVMANAIAGLEQHQLDRLENAFRKSYDQEGWRKSRPYPGVEQGLNDLQMTGFCLYIVTNKPSLPTRKIIDQFGWGKYFLEILSPDTRIPIFDNKTESLNYLIDKRKLERSKTSYIGDNSADMRAAKACGITFLAIEYGYGPMPESRYRIHQFLDIFVYLDASSSIKDNQINAIHNHGRMGMMINQDIFEDLFVLELANNHWGDLQRGLRIVKEFGTVVRYNNVRAAIKLQFRDIDSFIHKDFIGREDIRYIKKTLDTRLTRDELATLVEAIRRSGCLRMATPFDESSVELCVELGLDIIKIASSDVTDWPLLEKIAKTRKPVVVSTGGTSLKDIDDMVTFFQNRNIPLAINHCVSMYPSEDSELQLNQIDFLKNRYPGHVIGLSTHEHNDWRSSIMIAYAKGARTFERHVDIKTEDRPFTPYCSTPEQVAEWIQAFKKAQEMCGAPGSAKHISTQKELEYLAGLVRGVYARVDLPEGHVLTLGDYYLAIPLQKGQLSCRELLNDQRLSQPCAKDAPLMVDMVDSLYNRDETLREAIYKRGL